MLIRPAGMAGGCRHQGGAAPLPEGAGASDILSEDGVQPSGGRGAFAEPTSLPSGVFPVWRGSSGGSGETQAGLRLLPALWTCLQRRRDCLLLQVRVDPNYNFNNGSNYSKILVPQ